MKMVGALAHLQRDALLVEDAGPRNLAAEARREIPLAAPIAMAGQVVAVLYANSGASGAIEILARFAARSLEALTAFKAARALSERPGDPPSGAAATSSEAALEEDASARQD